MSQFVTVQVGQCGNQIGGAFWPLALYEHGIGTTLKGMDHLKMQKKNYKHLDDLADALDSFFYVPKNAKNCSFKQVADLEAAKIKARAVLIDMEDSVVSRFKQGPLRNLFDQTCTITNYPGSGNNWAMGYHTHGRAYHNKIQEAFRKTTERCDSLHGFLLLHSMGGGTGSGLGTRTLSLLAEDYPRIDRFVCCVYPALNRDVITAPYNVLLATEKLVEFATCVFPADNSALFDICNSEFQVADKYYSMCQPFQDMNSIVVNMLLHLTSGARFAGDLDTDMNEIATNLVPYPKLHFLFSSVSPISLTAPEVPTSRGAKLQDELFSNVWSRKNQLLRGDPLNPNAKIIGSAHIVRGNVSLTDVRRNIERFQSRIKGTSWFKEATKVSLCSVPPFGHPTSVLSLLNSSSISSMLKDIVSEFDKLYQRKAHVHHYLDIDGFEDTDFLNARSNIDAVCKSYSEMQTQKSTTLPRLRVV